MIKEFHLSFMSQHNVHVLYNQSIINLLRWLITATNLSTIGIYMLNCSKHLHYIGRQRIDTANHVGQSLALKGAINDIQLL